MKSQLPLSVFALSATNFFDMQIRHADNSTKTAKKYYSFCQVTGRVNGSQLAKMKKSIPDMSLPWNL